MLYKNSSCHREAVGGGNASNDAQPTEAEKEKEEEEEIPQNSHAPTLLTNLLYVIACQSVQYCLVIF